MISADPEESLVLIRDELHVRIITLNRPEKRNALNAPLTRRLIAALEAARSEPDVHCIVLEGAGPSFCAGQDLAEMASNKAAAEKLSVIPQTRKLHGLLRDTQKPLLAAVRGGALGGGAALMLGCDIVVAGHSLRFGYPEVPKGIFPGIVVASLVRHIGPKLAFEMIARGKILDANQAVEVGLVNQLVDDDRVETSAAELARELAAHRPDLIAEVKRLFYRVGEIPYDEALDAGFELARKRRG